MLEIIFLLHYFKGKNLMQWLESPLATQSPRFEPFPNFFFIHKQNYLKNGQFFEVSFSRFILEKEPCSP
jgi:hypothetical protein